MIHCADMAIRNSTYHKRCIWDPHFGEGHRRESSIVPFAMVVSYRLSIVTCDHSAEICHPLSASLKCTGGGSVWVKIFNDMVCREWTLHAN